MNTEELLQQVRLTHRQTHQRFGQALVNQGSALDPRLESLSFEVAGTWADPYESNDEAAPVTQQFINRVREILG